MTIAQVCHHQGADGREEPKSKGPGIDLKAYTFKAAPSGVLEPAHEQGWEDREADKWQAVLNVMAAYQI